MLFRSREFRKPLIIMTPKSLLRHPRCISALDDFTRGGFVEIIDDASADASSVNHLVLCSGKLYYELLAEKENRKAGGIALVRMEQLYPFPKKQLDKIISKYSLAKKITWAQEEPENMGAWNYLQRMIKNISWNLVSRHESASPATGSHQAHDREQKALIEEVFKSQL